MNTIAIIFAFLFLSLFSCQNNSQKDNFYSYSKTLDLWRVPILEPYEIVSATNTDDWVFVLKNPMLKHKDYFNPGENYDFQLSSIDSVGVVDSILIFKSKSLYWPKLGGDYKTTLFVNAKTREQFIYSDKHHSQEIAQKIKDLRIREVNLYNFAEVKQRFQADMTLPKGWRP
jgi:hypothetical protein